MRERERNLEARSSENTNGGPGPRDFIVKEIEKFPRIVEAQESGNVDDFAFVTEIKNLPLWGFVRVWVGGFTDRRELGTHRSPLTKERSETTIQFTRQPLLDPSQWIGDPILIRALSVMPFKLYI